MKKSRRFLMAIFAFMLPLAAAWADDVAQIGSTKYSSLAEAFENAAPGETVLLLQDVDVTGQSFSQFTNASVGFVESITLDGGGFTLTVDKQGLAIVKMASNSRANRAPAAAAEEGLDVTIKNITIKNVARTANYQGGRCITTRGDLKSLTLNNVTLTTANSAFNRDLQPLFIGGNQTTAPVINITNSTIATGNPASSKMAVAVSLYNPAQLNISGSTISGLNAVRFFAADNSAGAAGSVVNVSSSTINANEPAFYFADNNNQVNVTGSTINAASSSVAYLGSTSNNLVSLQGAGNVVTAEALADASADAEMFSVAGGKFSAVVPDKFLAEGYICHKVAGADGKFLVEEGTYAVKIGEEGYPTMTEAFKCAADGDVLVLQRDVDATTEPMYDSKRNLGINNSITLDGNNYTLTVKGRGIATTGLNHNIAVKLQNITVANSVAGGRCIDTRGFMESLTLENATLTTASAPKSDYDQPLTIGGNQADVMLLTIKNSTIETSADGSAYYAITTFNPVNATVEGSTLKGWACIYAKGADGSAGSAGSTWNIKNSKLYSTNKYPGESNAFSAIQINDNNVTVNIEGSELHIDATQTDQYQAITSFANKTGCKVGLGAGNTVDLQGEGATYAFNLGSSELEIVAGNISNVPFPEAYCAEGFIPVKNEDGTYGVKEGEFIVDGNDGLGYETLQGAVAAGNTTLTLRTAHAAEGVFSTTGVTVASDLTIDLNGLTLNATEGLTLTSGTLTFTNGGLVKGAVVANGGTLAFDESCGTNELTISGDESLSLASGKFLNDIDEKYLAEHYATNLISGAYVVKATIQIATVADLQALATLVNTPNGTATKGNTYELIADLDMTGVAWTPIGNQAAYPGRSFQGTFDGKNHTISNLKCIDNSVIYATAALFGSASDATIKNITLVNVDIQSTHEAAGILGYHGDRTVVTITNCHVDGGTIFSTPELLSNGNYDNGDKVGGILGYGTSKNAITNCSVKNVTITGYRDLGGIAGFTSGTVTNSSVEDTEIIQSNINAYKDEDQFSTAGEIVGGRSSAAAINEPSNTATNVTIGCADVARVGDKTYATVAQAVAAATEGQTVEIYVADTYTLPNLPKNITIKGTVEGVIFNCEGSADSSIASIPNGATFENVTMNFGTNDYHGFQHPGTITMNGCTLNGKFFSYGDMDFVGCTFNAPGTEESGYTAEPDYSMWAYSGNLTYTNCTFNCKGKCINVYNEGGATLYTVTAKNCTFNSETANKAAFNVKATCGTTPLKFKVIIENCEATGSWPATSEGTELVVLNALAQVDDIKTGVASDIEVIEIKNGVETVHYPARVAEYKGTRYNTLAEALDAAETANDKNIVINLLNDAELTIAAWSGTSNSYAIGTAETETITINGNEHKLTFMTTDTDWNNVATMNDAQTKLVLNNMTLDQGGRNTNGTWNAYDINFNCAVELNNVTSNRPIALKNDAALNNVTINVDESKDVYGLWIQTNGQSVSIDGLTMNVPSGRAIAVKDQYVNTEPATTTALTITNASFTTATKAAILVTAKYGAKITASSLDITNVAADSENAVWVDKDLANKYGEITFNSTDETMIPEGGVDAYSVVRKTGEKVEGYYKELPNALAEAEADQTIELKADFELSETKNSVETPVYFVANDHKVTLAEGVIVYAKENTYSEVFTTADAAVSSIEVTETANGYAYEATAVYYAQIGDNKYRSLQAAVDAAYADMTGDQTITVLKDIEAYTVVRQKAGLNLTIDGQDQAVTMKNQIVIDGDGRAAGTETLTIKGIKFEGDNTNFLTADAFIAIPNIKNLPEPFKRSSYNYAHNVTIENCSFTSTSEAYDVVGVKATSGAGLYNLTMNGVEATNLHSLAQLTATTGATIEDCNVSGGESFANIDGGGGEVIIKNNEFASAEGAGGYGLRMKGGCSATVTLEDNNFKATTAVVLGKNDAPSGTINIVSGTYVGAIAKNTTAASTGKIAISGGHFSVDLSQDAYKDFIANLYYGESNLYPETPEAPNGVKHYPFVIVGTEAETGYATFAEAVAAVQDGETIQMLDNVTMDADLTSKMQDGESFAITFGDYSIEQNGFFLKLNTGVSVTTDKETDLFAPVNATDMITVSGTYTYKAESKESQGIYELVDGTACPYALESDVTAEKVTYTRKISGNLNYYTPWFVPFDYTIKDEDAKNFTFFKINMIANASGAGEAEASNEVWVFVVKMNPGDKLHGNKPYVFKAKKAGTYEFVSENVTLKARTSDYVLQTATTTDTYSFYGTYETTPLEYSPDYRDLYMAAQGKLSYPTADKPTINLGAYRWYIHAESKKGVEYARSISFIEGDGQGATGIENTVTGEETPTYYTLDGVQVKVPGKGIYIMRYANGKTKKVSIK